MPVTIVGIARGEARDHRHRPSDPNEHRALPEDLLEGLAREGERRSVRRDQPGLGGRHERDVDLGLRRGSLPQQALESGADVRDVLARGDPYRDVRPGVDGQDRLDQVGRPATEAVNVDGWLGPRPDVVLRNRAWIGRTRPDSPEQLGPAGKQAPALQLFGRRRCDPDSELLGYAPVLREHGRERLA